MPPVSAAARDWPVVDRTSAIEQIARGLARRPFPAVLLTGPTGIGKSTLARGFADSIGGVTVEVVGLHELQDVPLGAFAPLLSSEHLGSSDVATRLSDVVRAIAKLSPSLLLVDDAPLLDDISAAAIFQLARFHKLRCLLTARDQHVFTGPLRRLEHEGVLERVEVTPFSISETEVLLSRRFGQTVEPESVRSFHTRTQGNPLLARTLALAAEQQNTIHPGDSGAIVVNEPVFPRHALDAVRAGLDSLEPAEREVAELLALTQPISAMFLPHRHLAETLIERGLFSDDLGLLRLAHPLTTEALIDSMTEAHRALRVDAAATALFSTCDPPLRFRGLLLQVRHSHHVSPSDLAWAAAYAHSVQDHTLATKLARLSLADDISFDAALALGSALSAAGSPDAGDALKQAITTAATDYQRALAAQRLAAHRALREGQPGEAVALVEHQRQFLSDPAALALIDSDVAKWRSMAGEGLPSAIGSGDAPQPEGMAQLSALIGRAMIASMSGDTALTSAASIAARPLAAQYTSDFPVANDLLDLNDFLVLVFEGRLHDAEQYARKRHDRVRGDATGMWSYTLGLIASHTGRATEALTFATAAVSELAMRDFTGLHGPAIALRITAESQLGVDSPRDGELSETHLLDIKVKLQLAEARAWRLAWSGDLDGAVDIILDAVSEGVAADHPALAALTAATACRFHRGGNVSKILAELSSRTDSALIAALARAAAAQATTDPRELALSAEDLWEIGYLSTAIDLWELAAAHCSRPEHARLYRDTAIKRRDGWTLLSITKPSAEVTVLTPREVAIAQAAAARQRSHEIARTLGISTRTVDNTLGRIYRKLGVGSRLELAARLAKLDE